MMLRCRTVNGGITWKTMGFLYFYVINVFRLIINKCTFILSGQYSCDYWLFSINEFNIAVEFIAVYFCSEKQKGFCRAMVKRPLDWRVCPARCRVLGTNSAILTVVIIVIVFSGRPHCIWRTDNDSGFGVASLNRLDNVGLTDTSVFR